MIALAWPFVALVAIGVVAVSAHRLVLSRKAEAALQAQMAELQVRIARQEMSGPGPTVSVLAAQVADIRKRLETADLRKLGGVR